MIISHVFANGMRVEWGVSTQSAQGGATFGSSLSLAHQLTKDLALSLQTQLQLGDTLSLQPQLSLSRVWGKHVSALSLLPRGLVLSHGWASEEQSVQATWQHVAGHTALDLKGATQLDEVHTAKSRLRVTGDSSQLELGITRQLSLTAKLSLWLELNSAWGVGLRLAMKKDPYSLIIPLRVSGELDGQSIGLAILIPTLLTWLGDQLGRRLGGMDEDLVTLHRRQQHEAALPMEREQISLVHELMAPIAQERRQRETLIIQQAWIKGDEEHKLEVSIPLTLLIQDACLLLPSGPKDQLPGFIDVQWGYPNKRLEIAYLFNGQEHWVCQAADLPLRLPQRHHLK